MPSNQTTEITILYPSGSDATFDMKYYLSTHMPLVQEKWGPEGLLAWKVLEFDGKAGYSVQATLEFPDVDTFQKAVNGEAAKAIFGDVPNFSNKQPTLLTGKVMGEANLHSVGA